MYIIYRIDNDDGEIIESIIGVINGDENVAIEWMSKNSLQTKEVINGIPLPLLRCRYIKELKN